MEEAKRQGAAILLQGWAKAMAAERRAAVLRARARDQKIQASVLLVQGVWRKFKARQKLAALHQQRAEYLQNWAATRLPQRPRVLPTLVQKI